MDNDRYERTVSVITADGIDTYTVVDPNNSDFTITFPFPTGTDLGFVYSIINSYEPVFYGAQQGNILSTTVVLEYDGWPSGNTMDRPFVGATDGTYTVGFMFFDQTLMKPIWYVGFGPTGWVDSNGTQV